jgi:hypothetical protein
MITTYYGKTKLSRFAYDDLEDLEEFGSAILVEGIMDGENLLDVADKFMDTVQKFAEQRKKNKKCTHSEHCLVFGAWCALLKMGRWTPGDDYIMLKNKKLSYRKVYFVHCEDV